MFNNTKKKSINLVSKIIIIQTTIIIQLNNNNTDERDNINVMVNDHITPVPNNGKGLERDEPKNFSFDYHVYSI